MSFESQFGNFCLNSNTSFFACSTISCNCFSLFSFASFAMLTPELVPILFAPHSSIRAAERRSRTPPAAFTPHAFPTAVRMSKTCSGVAPPSLCIPVEVFTKSAPAARQSMHASTISSGVCRHAVSMMIFTTLCFSWHVFTIRHSSRWTSLYMFAFIHAQFITTSISSAPRFIKSRVSKTFASVVVVPSGNPVTQHTITPDPLRSSHAMSQKHPLTQTDAKPCSLASLQSFTICSGVISFCRRVWSIILLTLESTCTRCWIGILKFSSI